jgi:hypothetical protein
MSLTTRLYTATPTRNDTLEEAAQVCDTEWNGDADTYAEAEAANECAAAIRALKEPT